MFQIIQKFWKTVEDIKREIGVLNLPFEKCKKNCNQNSRVDIKFENLNFKEK